MNLSGLFLVYVIFSASFAFAGPRDLKVNHSVEEPYSGHVFCVDDVILVEDSVTENSVESTSLRVGRKSNKLLAATLASAVSVAVTYPLDLEKIRRQFKSGQKGHVYKGVWPFGVAVCTSLGVGISSYDHFREEGLPSFGAGAIATFLGTTVATPLWVFRSRKALAPMDRPYTLRNFITSSGSNLTQAYHGYMSSMSILPLTAGFYGLYEEFNRRLEPYFEGAEDDRAWKQSLRNGLAAASARVLVTGVSYPIEVVRTFREVEGLPYQKIVEKLYAEGKLKRFYSGFPVAMLRVAPSTAISMGLYPRLRKMLDAEEVLN